jgi:Mrp family chromosome partitioning ATPase
MQFARERGAELIGVVENMVGGGFTGRAGEELACEFGVPVLARIPWHPSLDAWDGVARRL